MNKPLLTLFTVIIYATISVAYCCDREALGLVGKIQTINGNPYGIDVYNRVAYLVDFTEGSLNFQAYDISNPKAPVRISAVETTEQMDEVVVRGNRAYIANDALGVSIFDLSNPRHPIFLGNRSDGAYANSVAAASFPSCRSCALAGYHYFGQLRIYDVSNPASISEPFGYANIPNTTHVFDVSTSGNRIYLMVSNDDGNDTIKVLDASNLPVWPTLMGEIALPQNQFGSIGNLVGSGRYLYFAASYSAPDETIGGLRVINVGDPTNAKVIGRLDIADIGHVPWKGVGLAITKRGESVFAYMVGKTALHVIDVSKPWKPIRIASYSLPREFGTMVGGFVVVQNEMAFVAAARGDSFEGYGGLAIYRVAKKGGLPYHHFDDHGRH